MILINYFKKKIQNLLVKLDRYLSDIYFVKYYIANSITSSVVKPFRNISLEGFPEEAKKSFQFFGEIEQTEYIYELKGKYIIEPKHGWILDFRRKYYFHYSFPYIELFEKPSFFQVKIKRRKIVKYQKVINLRYYFFNYWHVLNDVLGQLALLDTYQNDDSFVLLVPEGALSIPYFKSMIERSSKLKNRNWVEHKSDFDVEAEVICVVKNLPNTKKNILSVLDLLDYKNATLNRFNGRRIFITRASHLKRTILNIEKIESLVISLGFEIVDNDQLSFDEQIKVYSEADLVIGIHGAGLANLMFRYPNSLHFIEIFPGRLIPPHYFWLCKELGFKYGCIVGEKLDSNNKFYLSPELLINYFKEDQQLI